MNEEDLKNIIKHKGHWCIEFTPKTSSNYSKSTEKLGEVVLCSQLPAYGICKSHDEQELSQEVITSYSYPYYPKDDRQGSIVSRNPLIVKLDKNHHKQLYKLNTRGMFLDCIVISEDWIRENKIAKPYIQIRSVIYRLTEVYEFLSRIMNKFSFYDDGVIVKISINNNANRVLILSLPLDSYVSDDINNNEWPYIAVEDNIILEDRWVTKEDIQKMKYKYALEDSHYILNKFKYDRNNLEKIQNELIEMFSGDG